MEAYARTRTPLTTRVDQIVAELSAAGGRLEKKDLIARLKAKQLIRHDHNVNAALQQGMSVGRLHRLQTGFYALGPERASDLPTAVVPPPLLPSETFSEAFSAIPEASVSEDERRLEAVLAAKRKELGAFLEDLETCQQVRRRIEEMIAYDIKAMDALGVEIAELEGLRQQARRIRQMLDLET